MSWPAIARKEFRDARRSTMLWGATAVFLLVVSLLLESNRAAGGEETSAAELAMSSMLGVGMFLLPLIVLVIGYLSITGERESGSIRYLLGLPTTRRAVVTGTFVGRSLVATVAIGVALLGGAVVMALRYGTVPVGEYAGFSLLTLYFAVVWTGIAVGVSALSATRGRALAGVLGIYFLFSVVWLMLPDIDPRDGAVYVVEALLGMEPIPELYDFVLLVSPSAAYATAVDTLVLGRGGAVAGAYGGEIPFYLQDWFTLVILLGWLIVPLAVGYLRFVDAELS